MSEKTGKHYAIYIDTGKGAAGLLADGSLEFTGDYKPDEAAKRLWDAISEMMPGLLRQIEAENERLRAALQEIRDMHDGEEDCDDGPDGIADQPNRAMQVNSIIDAVL